MIKHIVMWTFADEALGRTKAENLAVVVDGLRACAGVVDGMGAFEVSPAQDGLEASYDLCLSSEFADAAALAAYAAHPTHRAVAEVIGQVRIARVAFDYDTERL